MHKKSLCNSSLGNSSASCDPLPGG
jgi:hypothetical protein